MENNISTKKISKLMAFIFYYLSEEEKEIHLDCFLSFSYLCADNCSRKFLAEYLYEFFKSKRDDIETYLRENLDNYECKIVQKDIEIITKIEKCKQVIVRDKTLEKRRNRAKDSLIVIGSFYKSISYEDNINETIMIVTDKIIKDNIDYNTYCELETTVKYLALFLSSKKCCENSLYDFFNNFKEEFVNFQIEGVIADENR